MAFKNRIFSGNCIRWHCIVQMSHCVAMMGTSAYKCYSYRVNGPASVWRMCSGNFISYQFHIERNGKMKRSENENVSIRCGSGSLSMPFEIFWKINRRKLYFARMKNNGCVRMCVSVFWCPYWQMRVKSNNEKVSTEVTHARWRTQKHQKESKDQYNWWQQTMQFNLNVSKRNPITNVRLCEWVSE